MYLHINPNSGTPVYLQIIDQIKHAISMGVFEVGKPIPTIRDIALELGVNPNTVAKSIRELEREGFLKTYVGKGSFVSEKALESVHDEKEEKIMKLAESFIKDVKWLGFSKNDVLEFFEKNWEKIEEEVLKNVKDNN